MNINEHKSGSPAGLSEAFRVWGKIGFLSFGGPAAQIALMHKVVVEEKRWLKERQYLNALNFCMLLPGPEAMQLATYVGWRTQGVMGGLIAGLLFVLPGAAVILGLALIYSVYGQVEWVQALFLGVKAAVIVIVIEALTKVSKRALKSLEFYGIAFVSFIGIFALSVPFPMIIATAAIYGYFKGRSNFDGITKIDSAVEAVPLRSTVRTILIWLMVWSLPFLFLWVFGAHEVLNEIALFFSKLAVVTFGGAYAVLAYMAQDVVQANGWLTASEMVDGLGLAETTPGPLILVTEFVGFLAAEKVGGPWLGIMGALVTLWVTFTPCFLWIFASAPYLEWISAQPRLQGALTAITAAVVGVILNLSIWFAMHVFFNATQTYEFWIFSMLLPQWSGFEVQVLLMSVGSAIMLLKLHWNLLWVLMISAICGFLFSLF